MPALAGGTPSDPGDCSTSGDLTQLMTDGTLQQGRSVAGFNTMAYDPTNGVAYVPHFDGPNNVITTYQPSTQTVLECGYPVGIDKGNSHNGVSLNVDSDGYLQMVIGRHGTPPLYKRSAQPDDPTLDGGLIQPKSLHNDQLPLPGATYPQIYSNPADANQLLVLSREKTEHGNAQVEITTSSDHGDTWTPGQTIVDLTGNEPGAKVYPEIAMAPNGNLSLVFTPHRFVVPGKCNPYDDTDIYYVTSPDFGQTWTKADGTPITLPITTATADVAVSATSDDERIQAKLGMPIAFDENNQPIIIYRQYIDSQCTKPDSNPASILETRWDGTEWTTPTAVNAAAAHTGYFVNQLEPDRNIIQVYATRQYHGVPVLVVYRSTDYGATWSSPNCLTDTQTTSIASWASDNRTDNDQDLIEYASGTSGYLLDRSESGNGIDCPGSGTS